MVSLKQLLVVPLSLGSFAYTFYVVGRLMFFLSEPKTVAKNYTWLYNLLDNKARLETAIAPIIYDALYTTLFIMQHSFMKSSFIKNTYEKLGLSSAERPVYNLTSSLCLHYLIKNWLPAPSIVLWQVDVNSSNVLWWSFALLHIFAWIIIYGGSIIMDLPDIMGIKQVYYEVMGYAPPAAYKAFELRRLYSHVRHPSFVGFIIILWCTNLMSVDRLLLSSLLTYYMYVAWSTDDKDYKYLQCQFKLKLKELKTQ